jgi:2',3'-cyclic-nucleotide 2'-phosphodiesterase (5'-nucleotidase family)
MAVARNFPELDVIIGGHSHTLHEEQLIHGVLYTQAKYWGTYLGRVDLIYDADQKKLISKKAIAIPMNSSVPLDAELLELLKPDLTRAEKYLNTIVGEAAEIFDSRSVPTGLKRETPVFNLICASIADAIRSENGKVDAVIHGTLNERAALKPGSITMRNLFELVPYENTIGVAHLSHSQLLEILEENASAYKTGRFRGLWGMTMKLRISAPEGKRVVFLGNAEGKSMDPKEKVFVAFNSFDLASGGARWKRLREIADDPTSELKEYHFQTRDVVASYIRKHSPLKAEHHGWWSLDRTRTSTHPSAP